MAATGCSDWKECPLSTAVPAGAQHSRGRKPFCCLDSDLVGQAGVPSITLGQGSCSPACAPALPLGPSLCTSVNALLPWGCRCARLQSSSDAPCALWWNNLTSPDGTRWASTSQARFYFSHVCVCFCLSSLLWLHSSVTHITWGNWTFIPHNSVILHSRVLLMGNFSTIQGAFKWDFTTIKWNFVPKITQFLLSNFGSLENSGKDCGKTPCKAVLCATVGFPFQSLCAPLAAFGWQLLGQWKLWGWIQSGEQ